MAYRCKNNRGDYDGMAFHYWNDASERAESLRKTYDDLSWWPEEIKESNTSNNTIEMPVHNSVVSPADNSNSGISVEEIGKIIAFIFSAVFKLLSWLIATKAGMRTALLLCGVFFAYQINNVYKNRSYVEKSYYENGNIKMEQTFAHKKLNGISTEYYENGKIKTQWEYKDGKLNGIAITYFENGEIEREQTYKDDVKNGLSRIYYPNGNLKSEAMIKGNKLHGASVLYDEKGNVLRREIFENGKSTSIIE